MGIGSWITDNIGKPVGGFVSDAGDWLANRSGGQHSDIPGADRGNFNTPGGDERAARLRSLADSYGGRVAPQAANDSSFRGDQQALVDRLRRQMSGEDSLSQLQLRGATDANIAQQRSLAASATPGNAAMMQRVAAQNIGRTNQGYGSQAAQLGIQERNAAANALGAVAQGARGQDQQNNQFNTSAQLQQTGMNDQAAIASRGQELANAGLRQQGNMGYEANQTTRRGQDLATPQAPQNWERAVGAAGAIAPFFMAEGGVAMQPTDAVVGEAGPEMILPLARLPELVDQNANRSGADTMRSLGLQRLAQANDDQGDDRTQMRDAAIAQGQKSDDPLVRGISGIAGAYMHGQAKDKAASSMKSGLASIGNPHASAGGILGQLGIMGQMGGGDPGYTLMGTGGVVTQPTRAIVGEAGPEVVVPLHKLPTLVERLGAVAARTKQTARPGGGGYLRGAGSR